jgi:hypothetical protein
MIALGGVIVSVVVATLSNPLASRRIPFIEALLRIKNMEYIYLMAQYWYHIEATVEYMGNYQEELHRHLDVFSPCRNRKCTRKVSEALNRSFLWTNRRNG